MADIPEDLQQRIAAYIDGQLPPAEAARLEVFLANTDPALADALVGMLTDKVQLKALPKPRPPVDLAARIMEQVERGSLLRDVEHLGGQRRSWWQTRAAIAAGLVIVLGGFTYFVVSSVIRPSGRAPQIAMEPAGPRELAKAGSGSAAPADAARSMRDAEVAAGERGTALTAKEGSAVAGATPTGQTVAQADLPLAKAASVAAAPMASLSSNASQTTGTMPAGTLAMEPTADNISRQLSAVARDSGSSAAPVIVTLWARDEQDFSRLQTTLAVYAAAPQRGQALAAGVDESRSVLAIQAGQTDPRAGVRSAAPPNAANQSLGQIAAAQAQPANPVQQQQNPVPQAQSTYNSAAGGIGAAFDLSSGNSNAAGVANLAVNGNGVLIYNPSGPVGNALNPAANNYTGTTTVNGGVVTQNVGGGNNPAENNYGNKAANLYQDQNLANRAGGANNRAEPQNLSNLNSSIQQAVARGGPYRVTLTYEQLQELARTYHVAVVARGNEAAYFFRAGDRVPPTADARERADLARRAGFASTESIGGLALAGGRGGGGGVEPNSPHGQLDAKTGEYLPSNDKGGAQSLDAAKEKDQAALQPPMKPSAPTPAAATALMGTTATLPQKSADSPSPALYDCIITMEPPAAGK